MPKDAADVNMEPEATQPASLPLPPTLEDVSAGSSGPAQPEVVDLLQSPALTATPQEASPAMMPTPPAVPTPKTPSSVLALVRLAVPPPAAPKSLGDSSSQAGGTPTSSRADGTPESRISADGTKKEQPVIPPEAEPFESPEDEIPDIRDTLAPRYAVGEHHLTDAAIRGRARRIFEKRADGSKKVSEQIWAEWKGKGPARKLLEDIFKRVGYDPDT